MANNYTCFSFLLNIPDEVRDWALKLHARLLQVAGIESDTDNPVYPPKDDLTNQAIEMFANMDDWIGFLLKKNQIGLWIYDDGGSCNVDNVAYFVQEVLKKWQLDQMVTFAWADTCDKPRFDEFGGGAVAITKDLIEWTGTYEWMRGQQTAYKNATADPTIPTKEEFVETVYEIAYGDGAINKGFSANEVLDKLREFSNNALLVEQLDSHDPTNPVLTAIKTVLPYFATPEATTDMSVGDLNDLKQQVASIGHNQVEAKYLQNKGQICPDCSSNDIEGDSFDVEECRLFQKVWCLNCEAEWTDVYILTGIDHFAQHGKQEVA